MSGSSLIRSWFIENMALRKEQWASYLGPLDSLFIGEYQIFILSHTVYKSKSTNDNAYFNAIGVSFLLLDGIFV